MEMTIKDLRNAIKDLPDDLPVFFRRIAPIAGNIERAGLANKDTFSSFGVVQDCLIIEPMSDDDDDEAQQQRAPDQAGGIPLPEGSAENAGAVWICPNCLEYNDGGRDDCVGVCHMPRPADTVIYDLVPRTARRVG